MTAFNFRLGCFAILAVSLSACFGGGGGGGGDEDANVASAVSAFGSDFQMAFNQGRNDSPIDVDLVMLSLDRTGEPFEF